MTAPRQSQHFVEIQKAASQLRNGRRADAVMIYEEIAAQAGDDAAVNTQLGQLCLQLGAPEQAEKHFSIAAGQEPDNADYLGFLGVALQQLGRQDDAFATFERAKAIDPANPSTLHGLAIIYMSRSDYLEARSYLEQAQELKPGDAGIRTNLATTLANLNEHELALPHAKKAMKLDPANPNAHYALGRILTELGRTDEAVRHFKKTIRQHTTFGGAYDLLSRIRKFTPADKAFINKTEKVLQKGMPAKERTCVHYALGKMYDDCHDFDDAFEHYRQANLLQKRPYDTKHDAEHLRQVKKAFDAASLERYQDLGHPSDIPVFIVGMPRSGTTLMERIIASHSRAAGAGELPEIPRIAGHVSPKDDLRNLVARTRENLTADKVAGVAETYLRVLRQGREDASRVVDKLPGNFLHLGLITTLFPNATIIHARRHALDTCLSCYFQNFTNVRWANDLEIIANVYRLYREAIAFWRDALPAGKIVDIVYEELIEDPATQSRRMIEACGLAWEADSLEFHKQEAVVRTASLSQVRQPIYSTSRMRWVNYADHVGELASTLVEFLQDDRELLGRHGIDLSSSGRGWLRRVFS